MSAHDYYQALGIPPRLTLDLDDLQQRFYSLTRQHHPDRFTLQPVAERQQAEEFTATLNDAFRTLKDPLKRAEYLLKQNGFDVGEQRSKDVPPELLEEVFELNMALEEVRSGEGEARPQLQEARERFESMRQLIDDDLQALFRAYDAQPGPEPLQSLRAALNRRRYIQNLITQVNEALGE